MEKLHGAREKVEESYTESDKIIDLQIEEVLIDLGNQSPELHNDVTDSPGSKVALNTVNLISVLSMNIINCENRKETNFVFKKFLFCCLS